MVYPWPFFLSREGRRWRQSEFDLAGIRLFALLPDRGWNVLHISFVYVSQCVNERLNDAKWRVFIGDLRFLRRVNGEGPILVQLMVAAPHLAGGAAVCLIKSGVPGILDLTVVNEMLNELFCGLKTMLL